MKGRVLQFSIQDGTGLISADDGNRYRFRGAQWQGSAVPANGTAVDFEVDGEQALAVFPDMPPAHGPHGRSATPPVVSGLAVASLVLAVLSLPISGLTGFFGLAAAVAAVICGHVARGLIRDAPTGTEDAEGYGSLALIGLVIGYISIAIAVLIVLVGILVFGVFVLASM